jgi:hypothetical protein
MHHRKPELKVLGERQGSARKGSAEHSVQSYKDYQVGKSQCEHLAHVRERDAHTL